MAVMLAVACSPPPPRPSAPSPPTSTSSPSPPPPIPRLGVSGTSLTLGGQPWWPIGINAYSLGTNWDINVGCGSEVALDGYFRSLPPHSLTRVAINSSMAVNKTTGRLDFTALDAVFDAADWHGQLLIPVLTSHEGSCEHGYIKDHDWYAGGWRTDISHGLPMSFADWLDTAVKRWGRLPAVAGWSAVGEPTPAYCMDHECHWSNTACPSDSATVLRRFFDDTGARIRELDPDTLIFSGHAGGGQCGSSGDDFALVGASPGLDVLEYHYYEATDDLPGDPYHGLQLRVEQARAVNKPLLVAELGLEAGSCRSPEDRQRELSGTITALREHGAAGALFWAYMPDPRPDECTLDIGPADPLMDMVGTAPPA
ncbi:beta-mannosidase [Mycolicibacterium sp. XJ870]